MPRVQDRTKKTMIKLGRSSTVYGGKGTAERYVDRSSKKHSKRGR